MPKGKRRHKHEEATKQHSGALRKAPAGESPESITPGSLVRRFMDEVDRLAEDFGVGRGLFSSLERGLPGGAWSPQVEMLERDGELVLRVDLPGLSKDDVKVELADNALTIEGERRDERKEKREGFYSSERSYGKFYRRLPLPQGVNTEDARASFRDGVLEVTMPAPKAEAKTARKLEISGETQPKSRAKAA
ncbi:MAG TPA: Hsp20/alpha crystallin family protein [Pyrinomonadaceae bacterium]|nr:Hsp20/alpha crystallin family protein [Pyrinomonadaceae bacterium]